ncbi:MAG: Rrf2 family transcriptional regulator [Calditrichaeota bacterium]|nr:Rrf2 family transcriptional regulator [Calditrichota bacterium]MCB0267359.1 Rrf2 family transcriptional regulator [Calditrichota bacterium]MCB0302038.1 Rrf2 family transcriptional regulator [Calditrichota bacterium]MCB9069339.1 Rrf2 family transcriptional regulator [Calditrichia bacterium]
MLKFSKKVEYALISLLYMANRESNDLITSRELAQHFNFPQELIGKVLQSLARCSYVRSVQGVRGGYELSSNPENIRLTQVIHAVDGPIRVVNCLNNLGDCQCDQLDYCNIRNPMEKLQVKLLEALHEITLKDLQDNTISFTKPVEAAKTLSQIPLT